MIKNGSVRKRGNKWYYSFEVGKIDGKRKRIERVCKNATTKAAALVEMAEAIKLYENGGIDVAPLEEITVKDLANIWSEKYVDVSIAANARQGYNKAVRDFSDYCGIYKAKSITRLHAQEYCTMLFNKGLADKTIQFKMFVAKAIFDYAITTLNLFDKNPISKYKIPKRNVDKKVINQAFSADEVAKIMQYFAVKKLYHYYIACFIAYKTGLREGEIFGLTPDDVDLKNGIINVRNNLQVNNTHIESRYLIKKPKTKASRRSIVIDNELLNELKLFNRFRVENKLKYGELYSKLYLNEHNEVVERQTDKPIEFFVCQENGRFVIAHALCAALKVAENHLKFKITMHSFRHTHATMLIENGLNIKAVQDRLGHVNVSTTLNIYAEATKKSQEQTLELLNKIKLPTVAKM